MQHVVEDVLEREVVDGSAISGTWPPGTLLRRLRLGAVIRTMPCGLNMSLRMQGQSQLLTKKKAPIQAIGADDITSPRTGDRLPLPLSVL